MPCTAATICNGGPQAPKTFSFNVALSPLDQGNFILLQRIIPTQIIYYIDETVNICILIDSPIVTVCRWQKKVDMEPFEKTEVG